MSFAILMFTLIIKNDHLALIAAIVDEILYMSHIFKGNTLKSIHIGGGTPSLLKVENLEK